MFVGAGMVLTWFTSFVFREFRGSFLTDSAGAFLLLPDLDLQGSEDAF
jgi:hypothetical protein